jgi:hypothetical protein
VRRPGRDRLDRRPRVPAGRAREPDGRARVPDGRERPGIRRRTIGTSRQPMISAPMIMSAIAHGGMVLSGSDT